MFNANGLKQHNNTEETRRIFVGDGYINAINHFLYLGSHTSYHLRDDIDIDRRIAEANKSIGFIGRYFKCVHLDLFDKYLIFMVMPMNLLLWGCEFWALRQSHLDRLDAFTHTLI